MGRWLLVVTLVIVGCREDRPAPPPAVAVDTETPTPSPNTEPPRVETTATTPTTDPITEDTDEGPAVVLRGDGLGAERFGAPVDRVIAGLTLRWGPPDTDTGWEPAHNSQFGVCPGGEARAVGWTGFSVLFSDGPTPHGPAGRRHFFSWYYEVADPNAPRPDPGGNRPPLRTQAGISVGATVADLQRAYGDKLELFDAEEAGGPFFGVSTPEGTLSGRVTRVDPTGVVREISAGGGCGE